jgi:hypothetical protein
MTLIPANQDMFMIAKKNRHLVSAQMTGKIDVNFMLGTWKVQAILDSWS